MVVAAKQHREEVLVTVSLNSEFVAAGQDGETIEAEGEVIRRHREVSLSFGAGFSSATEPCSLRVPFSNR